MEDKHLGDGVENVPVKKETVALQETKVRCSKKEMIYDEQHCEKHPVHMEGAVLPPGLWGVSTIHTVSSQTLQRGTIHKKK